MRQFKTTALIAIAALLIAGCEGTVQTKDEAAVEDRSTTMEGPSTTPVDSGVSTQGVPLDSPSGPSALDDPNNILSQRVIYFDYDSSEVRAEDLAVVEAHARYLLANNTASVVLEGHADERGSREYNVALGERRSLSVAQVMQLLGVPAAQLRTVSYGEERPADDGHDEVAWERNRRVELVY